MLNLHLLLKPLATSLFGVFDMDYSFVYKVRLIYSSFLLLTMSVFEDVQYRELPLACGYKILITNRLTCCLLLFDVYIQ